MPADKIQRVNVLWTGGLDSSFTMIDLSQYVIEIQPYYLCDNRRGELYELQAIREITGIIQRHPNTKCTILPLITKSTKDIEPDQKITDAFNRMKYAENIGSQYDWLARYAKDVPGLMMSPVRSETGRAIRTILKYGNVVRVTEGEVTYYVLNKGASTDDLITLYGNIRFAITWDYFKPQEVEEFRKRGFEEALEKTWFCHHPVNGGPCGTCNPCQVAIEDGLTWRFNEGALRRYKNKKLFMSIKAPFKYIKKEWYYRMRDI